MVEEYEDGSNAPLPLPTSLKCVFAAIPIQRQSVSYPWIWGWSCDLLWPADCNRGVMWQFWASASEHLHISTSSIETLSSCHMKKFRPSCRRLEIMFSSSLSCPGQHPSIPTEAEMLSMSVSDSSNANKFSQDQKNRSAEPNQNCTHRLMNKINDWYFKLKICAVSC